MLSNLVQIMLMIVIALQIVMIIQMMYRSGKEHKKSMEFYDKMEEDRAKAQAQYEEYLQSAIASEEKPESEQDSDK